MPRIWHNSIILTNILTHFLPKSGCVIFLGLVAKAASRIVVCYKFIMFFPHNSFCFVYAAVSCWTEDDDTYITKVCILVSKPPTLLNKTIGGLLSIHWRPLNPLPLIHDEIKITINLSIISFRKLPGNCLKCDSIQE